MSLTHIRMPSFTLVLTSNWHFLHGCSTAIKFDPCVTYTMLPIVIDHSLVTNPMSFFVASMTLIFIFQPTIDLVDGPADNNEVYIDQLVSWYFLVGCQHPHALYVEHQTTHKEPPSVRDMEKKVAGATKVCLNLNATPSFFSICL
jgi:hypothetical protein